MTRLLVLLVAALAVLLASAPGASAHGDDGTLEVIGADPAGSLRVGYQVRLSHVDDGHPAADATVTAVVDGAGAASAAPVPLTPTGEEGVYAGVVDFPAAGEWTVRFTALSPDATLERIQTVAAAPATNATTATTQAQSPTTPNDPTTAAPTTRAPTTTATPPSTAGDASGGASAAGAPAGGDADDSGGVNAAVVAGAGVAVLALGAVVLVWLRRRQRTA